MNPASWAARLARREVCASCSDPPVPGRSSCAYHLERHRQVQRARRDPTYVVPPPRPRAQKGCKTCGKAHRTKACPVTKRERHVVAARARQRREDRRYAAGLCVACEDKREPGNDRRRCIPCLEYQREAQRQYYRRARLKEAA